MVGPKKDFDMRYITLILLIAAPSVFSFPVINALPGMQEPSALMLVLAGFVGVVAIRRRQR